MSKMDLYEYSDLQKLPADFQLSGFKTFLNNVWQKYKEEKPEFGAKMKMKIIMILIFAELNNFCFLKKTK